MAERSKAHDWKSCVPPKGTVSSNLTLSAITKSPFMGLFVMAYSEDKNSREVSEFQDKKAVICFFIAESVVLFASKESDSNRSELTKQVTAAQLAIAFRQSLQARPTTSERL